MYTILIAPSSPLPIWKDTILHPDTLSGVLSSCVSPYAPFPGERDR